MKAQACTDLVRAWTLVALLRWRAEAAHDSAGACVSLHRLLRQVGSPAKATACSGAGVRSSGAVVVCRSGGTRSESPRGYLTRCTASSFPTFEDGHFNVT